MIHSKEDKTIVVIGATGRQGGQVARHLLKDGWQVRALTRSPNSEKAKALADLGAEVVQGNLDDRASIDGAFQGAYGVYNVQVPVPGKIEIEIRQGKTVADAAKAAKIQHLVYGAAGVGHSKTGIESWDAKTEIIDYMRAAELPLTVLRPMAFMELMVDPTYYPNASTWHIWPKLSGGARKIGWISVQDIGAIAAKVFANPEEFIGKDLSLATDIQSLDECRALYREVMGKNPSRFPMPMFLFKLFVGNDIPKMWKWLRTNEFRIDPGETRQILPEAMTVRDWLQTVKANA